MLDVNVNALTDSYTCIVYLYIVFIQDSTTLCTGWVHLTLWMSVPCVLSMRPYPDAPREGQPPLRQMMPHWVPRPASTEDENDVSLSLNHQLFIHNANCEDAPKMMSRSSVPIITKSHLAIFFCKNNQWWSYLNEKAIKAATNDCLHLQNKCCVTILLFLHMVLFSFGYIWPEDESLRVFHSLSLRIEIMARTHRLQLCFGAEWFSNWQFHIWPLDKSSDCCGRSWGHIGRNAICLDEDTFCHIFRF